MGYMWHQAPPGQTAQQDCREQHLQTDQEEREVEFEGVHGSLVQQGHGQRATAIAKGDQTTLGGGGVVMGCGLGVWLRGGAQARK